MVRHLAEFEDEQTRTRAEEDFRQRVYTSAINLFVKDFYSKVFDPNHIPEAETPGTSEVFFPSTDDEFDAMLAEFDREDAALKSKQFFDSLG